MTVQGSGWMHEMVYLRGYRGDYDGWVAQGCVGCDLDSVLPYSCARKTFVATRITGGPLPVEPVRQPHPAAAAFVEAAGQLGHPGTENFNGE